MTLAEEVAGIIDYHARLRESGRTDLHVLGDIVVPSDLGQEFVSGNNNYTVWYAIGIWYRPRRIAEIGVRFGYSLKALCRGAFCPPDDYALYAWDAECDSCVNPLARFRDYFRDEMGIRNVVTTKADTRTLSRLEVDAPVDMVSVDGDHSTEGALHDLHLAADILKPGGVIVCDDTNPGSVSAAVERFVAATGAETAFLPTLRGVNLIRPKPQ